MESVIRAVQELLDADRASLFIVDNESQELWSCFAKVSLWYYIFQSIFSLYSVDVQSMFSLCSVYV